MQEILSKKNIGERIKILRITNNHSQLFVADILSLSRSNYSQIELGNQFPTFETLYTISRYYSKSYEWLLHGSEQRTGVQEKSPATLEPILKELESNIRTFEACLKTLEHELSTIRRLNQA